MICFVILHYQAIKETYNCINSINKYVHSNKKIIIVDNASPNGTGKKLKENFAESDQIEVLLNNKNSGFANGNNLGYREAKKYNPNFIIVLNSDIVLTQDNFYQEISAAYMKYKFDILGPDIISKKTELHQNPQRNNNYTLKELFFIKRKLQMKNKLKFLIKLKYMILKKNDNIIKNQQNDYWSIQLGKVLHGAFYVFSKGFIEKHNNCFHEGTFMYFESYILHYLGIQEGLIFLYYPNIKVIHYEDASTDNSYHNQYAKSIFVNKCMLNSCKVFIEIIKNNKK